ncbi:calcium-binding and coiled-coil domain-containing protein 1 isoform X1 [Podarcis raffonei]|uniref:calcium-binding and coiled-coil domain-containing protein 1 isoform X1 n=1 Tax=Podarcis raffonei TaxID=65483 RepID=UPI00232963D6|nr:calcium-binding and coiled-coil domain-containing protein 1 isoform X1 [Podarcis raffonei]XP_053229948.1 calcium-binding and coiled-coil domain-containing protein 1 isoform X1 [Podarcis raffonei]XP_053229955.1 calcium-binding and coiled-coil domain-containing protein 1 isoform X1 [Podarcis raffonei]
MEEVQSQPGVAFLNVTSSYVPHTKVECHYSLPPGMKPSARDWIGIFKVESSSVRDYYTFVWCTVPDGGTSAGALLHCNVQFQASYLPKPGPQQYQFRYVDRRGEVRGQSSPFQFSEPRPMDELVTLEEASDDGGGTDMLLVVPKAALLETQLEESRQEQGALLQESCRLKDEVQELRSRVAELEAVLGTLRDEHTKLAAQYKELSNSFAEVSEQRDTLSLQEAEHVARIRELEGDIQAMGEKMLQRETELDRMKDTVKSLLREQEQIHNQLKEENAEKEQYQVKLQASEEESRSLASDLQEAKTLHGEKVSQTLGLQEDISKLQQKLTAANRRTVQMESLCEQLRSTQDILAASQQKVALLGEELASVASIRDRTISDLHKSRLEAAEINIKLADMTLKWKEGKGQWWKEKATLLQSMEAEKDKILKLSAEVLRLEKSLQEERAQRQVLRLELAQERDSSLVQVSESRRELRELRAALQVAQKEKEQLQAEKQELLVYIRRLEERLEKVADEKWSESILCDEEEAAPETPGSLDSPLSDSEDECPEDMRLPAQLGSYSLCDNRAATTTPPCARGPAHTVVISQPAPIANQIKQPPEDSSSDSEAEDEKAVLMAAAQSGGEETNLLLPELGSGFYEVASGLTGRQMSEPGACGMGVSPLDLPSPAHWKECPICHERFPPESDKETLDTHVDGHFFFSTHDPFTFE